MNIEELKSRIESKSNIEYPLVFKCTDTFIPYQYLKHMDDEFIYTDNETFVSQAQKSIFGDVDSTHYVYSCDTLQFEPKGNAVVICKKIESSISIIVDCVEVPKLDKWMIQDYAYSRCKGVERTKIDWLLELCKYDIHRLEQEIDKICLFSVNERDTLFTMFISDGVFSDMSDKNIFTMSNAIQQRDLTAIHSVYKDLETAYSVVDVEPLGLLTIMYQNFKKFIKVWLSKTPTESSTGLSSKQIWAINNLKRTYSKHQLTEIFKIFSSIENDIKLGIFPIDNLVDFIVIKALVTE